MSSAPTTSSSGRMRRTPDGAVRATDSILRNAVRIVVGLARSHLNSLDGGPHVFWIDQIGTAANPFAGLKSEPWEQFPPLETVTPSYKTYPLEHVSSAVPAPEQAVIDSSVHVPVPSDSFSAIARPAGRGFRNGCPWRLDSTSGGTRRDRCAAGNTGLDTREPGTAVPSLALCCLRRERPARARVGRAGSASWSRRLAGCVRVYSSRREEHGISPAGRENPWSWGQRPRTGETSRSHDGTAHGRRDGGRSTAVSHRGRRAACSRARPGPSPEPGTPAIARAIARSRPNWSWEAE